MARYLEVAACIPATTAEGPFLRFAIWTQGCSIRCPGCCNPHMFKRSQRPPVAIKNILVEIQKSQNDLGIEGITLVGGEPLDQLTGVLDLCHRVQQLGLGVIIFSGYPLEQAQNLDKFSELWSTIDTLVDGPFDRTQSKSFPKSTFVGSANQKIHHRSQRYADPSLWKSPNRAEIQIDGHGNMTLLGYPSITDQVLNTQLIKLRPGPRTGIS